MKLQYFDFFPGLCSHHSLWVDTNTKATFTTRQLLSILYALYFMSTKYTYVCMYVYAGNRSLVFAYGFTKRIFVANASVSTLTHLYIYMHTHIHTCTYAKSKQFKSETFTWSNWLLLRFQYFIIFFFITFSLFALSLPATCTRNAWNRKEELSWFDSSYSAIFSACFVVDFSSPSSFQNFYLLRFIWMVCALNCEFFWCMKICTEFF